MESIGLYIHIPFCVSKCPYCDFHSAAIGTPLQAEAALDAYAAALLRSIEDWAHRLPATTADTLYFGGGTPSLLGGSRLAQVIAAARQHFGLADAEITLEANPADDLADTLSAFAAAGGNRLSLGMQSAVPAELALLGRRHTPADVARTMADARRAGIENISLDVMLGVSGQTVSSACHSVDVAADLGATHLSAYLLKIEPNTPYGACPPDLPSEDDTVDLYIAAFRRMDSHGYHQYEISNAALPNCESRHNLKYWLSQPYLGIGPAASSCLGGRRFTYPRDTAAFIAGNLPVEDPCDGAPVGSAEEYALLRLRLAEGLTQSAYSARFGAPLPDEWMRRAAALPKSLVTADGEGIRLTRDGFLLSNTIISRIIG